VSGERYQFVDCRFDLERPELGRERYLAGHIPGASFLDLRDDLSDMSAAPAAGRHPLPAPEAFAASASRAGIGEDVLVVAYDDGMSGGAARLWWLLRHFGHERVAVLDGGLGAWAGPLRAGPEEIEPARFEVRPRAGDTIGADELAARLGEPELAIVDARSPERFRGDVEPFDPVAGHVPGARNWPHGRSRDVPAELLEAPEIVVYCGSGVTACVDLLALARAGRPEAKLFPGSWSEWSRRGLPVERGG
jgi:thiosulfate/3-mercaptopyruvate sulfurtransferase